MKTPSGYHLTKSCGTCRWAFFYVEYDTDTEVLCSLAPPARPTCPSIAMGEVTEVIHPYDADAMRDIRDQWADGREVDRNGLCDEWRGLREDGVIDEDVAAAVEEFRRAAKKFLEEPSAGTRYALSMAANECQLLGIDPSGIEATWEVSE